MRESIKDAMNIACSFAGKKPEETTIMIWSIGLKNYSDDDIKNALVNYCQHGESRFAVITPYEFMKYKNYDPNGNKAVETSVQKTLDMIKEQEEQAKKAVPMPEKLKRMLKNDK